MNFFRHRCVVSMVARIACRSFLRQPTYSIFRNSVVPSVYDINRNFTSPSRPFGTQKMTGTENSLEGAIRVVQEAEHNRLRLRLMSKEDREIYLKKTWGSMISDRGIRPQSISRYLNIRYELDLPLSYEEARADLKKLGLRPDAVRNIN